MIQKAQISFKDWFYDKTQTGKGVDYCYTIIFENHTFNGVYNFTHTLGDLRDIDNMNNQLKKFRENVFLNLLKQIMNEEAIREQSNSKA